MLRPIYPCETIIAAAQRTQAGPDDRTRISNNKREAKTETEAGLQTHLARSCSVMAAPALSLVAASAGRGWVVARRMAAWAPAGGESVGGREP